MTTNDFISVEKIISEVTQTVDDKNFKKGFSKGWFVSRIHDALQELALDTFYMKVVFDFDIPSNLRIKIPVDTFNVREIYVYEGEKCNPSNSRVVYHKRLFNNSSSGDGYTAKVKDDGSGYGDPFQSTNRVLRNNFTGTYAPMLYYNVQNGILMLGKECGAYPFLRVIFNGLGGVDGSTPMIPRFFQRAIVDYLEERYYNALKSRNPRLYRILWNDAYTRLYDFRIGSWSKARKRVSSMDSSEKESMEEYISSMYHR